MFELLKEAATAGGDILLKYFRSELAITNKTSHHNIVTQADTESQNRIKEIIVDGMKQMGIERDTVGFIGEEDLHEEGSHIFVIDPLDGTSNFATGTEEYCVLIAYFHEKELRSGIMYFPSTNTAYFAEKGKGAYVVKDGVKQKVTHIKKDLSQTFLYSSMSYDDDIESGIQQKLLKLKPLFRGIRMIGCAGSEISYLAQNIAGGVLLVGCSIWDIAPGKLILSEIGYEMYDLTGEKMTFNLSEPHKHYPFIACDPDHLQTVLAALS